MLDISVRYNDASLFLIYFARVLRQFSTAFPVCGQRDDAVHGQCSAVQTLYIFYYYIVVYIYCMHLSGQK